MKNRLLIITDNTRARWLSRLNRQIKNNLSEISVLTLGITPEYFRRRNSKKIEILKSFTFVNIDEISKQAQEHVAEFYINFIFKLPHEVPLGLFFYKGQNLWWFLKISEKCPVHSKLINRLFYLELMLRVIEKNIFTRIYIDLDDSLMAQTVLEWKPDKILEVSTNLITRCAISFSHSPLYFIFRYLRNCFGIFLLFLARSIALKANRIKGSEPSKKNGLFFFTNYPFWWNDPFNDKANEKFFGLLPEHLVQNYPVFYSAWLFSLSPLRIFFKKASLRRFFTRKNMVLLELLLKAREKLEILSLHYLCWALSVRRYFATSFKSGYREFNINKLVYYEIWHSLSHIDLFDNILIKNAVRRLTARYSPQAIIYRIEFSPFEKAILVGIEAGCKVISFQHSTLSRNLISHFFAPAELSFHISKDNSQLAMPLPDIIFTSGRYFRDIMIESGFPIERIEICGPLRYGNLVSYLKQDKQKAETKKRLGFSDSEKIFLVAMNWIEKEGMALVSSLVEAGRDIDKTVHFILKTHPHMCYDKSIKAFLKDAKSNLRYSFLKEEFSLYDAILISDGIIQLSATTLGYETMAIGRIPIVFENKHIFNINSSEELNGCTIITSCANELRNAIRLVLEGDVKIDRMRREWPKALEKFFYDLKYDPEIRFIELLKKHLDFNGG